MERRTFPLATLACFALVGCAVDVQEPLAQQGDPLVPPLTNGPITVNPLPKNQTPAWVDACSANWIRYHVFMREWDKYACHDIDVGTGVWRGANGATPGTCTFDWDGPGAPQYWPLQALAQEGQISYRGESPGWRPLVIQDCSPPCKDGCSKVTWAIPIWGMGRSPCSACGVTAGGLLHMTLPSFLATNDYVVRTPDGDLLQVFANGQQVVALPVSGTDGPVEFSWPLLP